VAEKLTHAGYTYQYVTDAGELPFIAQEVRGAQLLALDTETTGFDPHTCRVRLLSLNTGRNVYVVDAFKTGTLAPIMEVLNNPGMCVGEGRPIVVGQNLKFDALFLLHHYGVELWPIFDTFRASAMLYNGLGGERGMSHDLFSIYLRELKMAPQVEELGGSDWSRSDLTREQLDYAADDVIWLPKVYEKLRPKIREEGLHKTALLEFESITPEASVERNGFRLDAEAWLTLYETNKQKATQLREKLERVLPSPSNQLGLFGYDPKFSIDSRTQLLQSLRKYGLKTRVGRDAWIPIEDTKEATLAVFAQKDPIIKDVIEYNGYAKATTAFGPDYLKFLNPATLRIHASYYPMLATGRFAHSKPNLGQIPRGKNYRACFRPEAGRKLVIADYSAIEMVVLAEVTQDRNLLQIIRSDGDIHRFTASKISGVPESEVTKEQRQQAKPANFGFAFALGAEKFVSYALVGYGVVFSLKDAERIRDTYFESFPGVRTWHRKVIAKAERDGALRTLSGRRRFIDPEKEYAACFNLEVQGTAADGLKRALRRVYEAARKFPGVRMVHHVHDEIATECPEEPELLREWSKALSQAMVEGMQPLLPSVPVRAPAAVGDSWAEK